MIDKEKFKDLFEQSGLGDYYRKIDKLEACGLIFDKHGDLIESHDESLNKFLFEFGLRHGITASIVGLSEEDCEEAAKYVLEDAKINVFGVYHSNMGGKRWVKFYIDKRACEIEAKRLDKKTECPMSGKWEDYTCKPANGKQIGQNKVEVEGGVYDLSFETAHEAIKKIALAKLTKEERKVLGYE